MQNLNEKTRNLAKLGLMAAISVVLVMLIRFPIFPTAAPFLEYDPADIPIFITGFALGPAAGFMLTVVASFLQGTTVSSQSGLYGIIMHIIATGSYVLVSGNIYKRNKTKRGALIAMTAGTITWVLVMIPANLFITPIFLNIVGVPAPDEVVKSLLVPVIIPFNIIKSGANSIITMLIYKRISPFLHR